jgi:hypothetical protein
MKTFAIGAAIMAKIFGAAAFAAVGDGTLGDGAFPTTKEEALAKADTNADGTVSVEERKVVCDKLRKMGRRGKNSAAPAEPMPAT